MMEGIGWKYIISKLQNFEIKRGITSFVNPYSMLILKNNELIEGVDYWYMDGISLVKTINRAYKKKFNRYSLDDTSLAPIVFDFAKKNDLKIGVVGTKEEY